MFELAVRIALASGLLALSWAGAGPPFEPAWRALAFFATYSFMGFVMERRSMRNAGVSGLIAVADAGLVLFLLSAAGKLESFGFLALVPPAFATLRHSADAVAMAPIVSAMLLFSANLFEGPGWTPVILGQSVGVLVLGLLGAQRVRVTTLREIVEVPGESPLSANDIQTVFDLREKYRVLRDHAKEVERKARRDKHVVQLREALDGSSSGSVDYLGKKLREILEVDGIAFYSATGDSFLPQGSSGSVPTLVRDAGLAFPDFLGEWQLREKVVAQLGELGCEAGKLCVTVLKQRGRVEGLLVVFESKVGTRDRAVEVLSEINEYLTKMFLSEVGKENILRQTRQTELLYHIAGASLGADSVQNLASRVVRELFDSQRLDHVSLCFLKGDDVELAAQQGASGNPLSAMIDSRNPGTQELWVPDVSDSSIFDRTEALKRRIGSFALLPLGFEQDPVGFLCVYTHRSFGVSTSILEDLRLIASELSQALARLEDELVRPYGLATPREFHDAVKQARSGCLVVLEVLKKDELIENVGRPAVDLAVRAFSGKLRALLPVNGLLCRRAEGDFMVLLRGVTEDDGRAWAARAVASAALVPVAQGSQRPRAPLAIKSKVSLLAQQSDRISPWESKVVDK